MRKISYTFQIQIDETKTGLYRYEPLIDLLIMKCDLSIEDTIFDGTVFKKFTLYPYKRILKHKKFNKTITLNTQTYRGIRGALYVDIRLNIYSGKCTAKIIDFNLSLIKHPNFLKKVWPKAKRILRNHHVDKIYFDKNGFKAPNLMNETILNYFYRMASWDGKEGTCDFCKLN